MSDISNSGDLTQATTLRTVTPSEVSRPNGTITNRPVEEDASVNSGDTQSQANFVVSSEEEQENPLDRATNQLESLLADSELPRNTRLRITLDEEGERFIYQSIDRDTGEVISTFPPEDIVDLLRSFRSPTGIAVDNSV